MINTQNHPVVLRMTGMFPADLVGYEGHRTRKGGDLGHVNSERSKLNRRLIGPEDWADRTRDMINKLKAENYADELETLTRRRRTSQIKKRMVEGPRDPWRTTRHGPLREVILTANREWFEDFDSSSIHDLFGESREDRFEALAVAWLKQNFGNDVVHARADLDESAYHIHAVIVPKVQVDLNGTKRWMLQPSKHPMIKDYEAAQDSVGDWFQPIGLKRGKRHASAIRAARQTGETPPPYRQHAKTAQWRAEQELEISHKRKTLDRREGEAAKTVAKIVGQQQDVTARELSVAAWESRVRQRETSLTRDRLAVQGRESAAKAKEYEAEAILSIADGLAEGTLDVDAGDGEPRLTKTKRAKPTRVAELMTRIARAPLGKTRGIRAFAAALGRLRTHAYAEAEIRVSRDSDEIKRADDVIVEIASHLPTGERSRIAKVRVSLAARIVALSSVRRGPKPSRKSPSDRGFER